MTQTEKWTFEGYWRSVIGDNFDVCAELTSEGGKMDLDEWLGVAEAEAWLHGGVGGPRPEEWADLRKEALDCLWDMLAACEQHAEEAD